MWREGEPKNLWISFSDMLVGKNMSVGIMRIKRDIKSYLQPAFFFEKFTNCLEHFASQENMWWILTLNNCIFRTVLIRNEG